MFVVMVALAPCKSYCNFFCLLIQRGDVYTADELPKSEEDLFDQYFVMTCLETVIIMVILCILNSLLILLVQTMERKDF